MAAYPEVIEELIKKFIILPGVGRKTAERYVLFLLKQSPTVLTELQVGLQNAQRDIRLCSTCYNFTTDQQCEICQDAQRDAGLLCVVADSSAIFALEQTHDFKGLYHVLGGTINQLEGIGPDQLRIAQLAQRIQSSSVREVIIGLNPDTVGESTALYVIEALKQLPVTITRLARGLPAGSDIEFADDITLGNALKDRRAI